MSNETTWCLAFEIQERLGITPDRLYYAKIKGVLKNLQYSPGFKAGKKGGGRTYYDLDEVKKVIPTVNNSKRRKTAKSD